MWDTMQILLHYFIKVNKTELNKRNSYEWVELEDCQDQAERREKEMEKVIY